MPNELGRLTPVEEWLLSLERERYDTSYRNPVPPKPREPVVEMPPPPPTLKQKAETLKRNRMFFDAGRFAAGATDNAAKIAWEQYLKETK